MNERLRTQSQLIFPILRPLLQIINIITLVVLMATLLEPIKLCLSVWFGPTAEQGTGIVAMFGAVIIGIRCNEQADIVRNELRQLFPSPDAPQRRGLRWPLVVGILLVLFSVLAAAPTISYLSVVWMLFALIFWMEGLFVAGKYRAAFGFALLATPIPQGIYRGWIDATSQLAALLASQLGNVVGTKSFVTTNGIIVNENTFTISFRSGISPHPTLWLAALIGITWLIWMKKTLKESLFWSFVAIFIAFVIHIARLVLIIVGARISVTIGNIILFIPWWMSTVLALGITAIIRRVWRIRKDRLNRFIVEGQANQWK
jgi:hypothetical protein